MWQQVTTGDEALLQTAVDVLKARNPKWVSPDQLRAWIVSRGAKLFYFHGPDFELVLGFHFDRQARDWRVITGGARGTLDEPAGREMAHRLVEFAQSKSVHDLGWFASSIDPSDPNRLFADSVISYALQLPEVADVTEHAAEGGVLYNLVLR